MRASIVVSLFFVLLLAGCGSTGPVQVTDNMVNEAGEVVQTGITEAADVDVVRSTGFSKMRMNRDNIAGRAHKNTGFRMKFTTVSLGAGFTAYLPEEISYTPELRFQDPMPVQEMVNPMYGTAERIILGVGDFLLKGWLGWLLNDAHSDSVSAAQVKYNGPYSPQYYENSFNQTAPPFVFGAEAAVPTGVVQ